MPIAQLYILEGRTDEQKERLIREVSEAMSRSIDSPIERVRVIITESLAWVPVAVNVEVSRFGLVITEYGDNRK